MTVVLSPHVDDHIKSQHTSPGRGSVFAKQFDLVDFTEAIEGLKIEPQKALYFVRLVLTVAPVRSWFL